MSEKKGPSGRHARAEIESGKIGSDGEVRLYTALSELVLAGVLHSGSMDLIRLFELVGIRKQPAETHAKKPAALPVEQAPVEAEPASRPPRLESADGLRFLYPSLSRGMLAHTKRVRDRALMGGLRPAPFKNADAVALLYPSLSRGMLEHLKGLHDRLRDEATFPRNTGALPDGLIAGDLLYDPTRYTKACGDELRIRRRPDPDPSNLPTSPRVEPVAPPPIHPHPEQLSDKLGNPPVQYIPIPPLPPKS